ncbi:MAG: hypothetical protein IJL62_01170 [Clostridia bacterium]|nr:hypothetical protein [Clostridia bacterium]
MTVQNSIPIVVGITGHRNIRSEDRDALYRAVLSELSALKARCPHSEIMMLNSLAEGADTLCAEAANALSVPLIAALPMASAEYEKDFSGEALKTFRALRAGARECFVVPAAEAPPASFDRDFAYRQAGIYVAAHAHVLLALWDGEETSASNCGTAEAVKFALHGAYEPADGVPLGGFGAVLHVQTPREGSDSADAGTVRFLGDRTAFDGVLARTDEFNRLAAETAVDSPALLPVDREPDALLYQTETLYAKADALSVRFAKQYRRILAALAIVSTVITIAFLLYDEAELHWMILVCGLALLAAWAIQHCGKRLACHRRYLEYRTLAEGLRVQAFLRYAGSKTTAADILSWSERTETGWIAAALQVVPVGAAPYRAHDIREPWINEQRLYHQKAGKKSERSRSGSERIVKTALCLSILLYLVVLVFECVWGDLLPFSGRIASAERYRTLAKLLLGSISAATLFISNYYGRLSLSRVASDHRRMERFYAAVLDRIERYGQTEDLLKHLAREELIENGNWCSYQRDNAADFNL